MGGRGHPGLNSVWLCACGQVISRLMQTTREVVPARDGGPGSQQPSSARPGPAPRGRHVRKPPAPSLPCGGRQCSWWGGGWPLIPSLLEGPSLPDPKCRPQPPQSTCSHFEPLRGGSCPHLSLDKPQSSPGHCLLYWTVSLEGMTWGSFTKVILWACCGAWHPEGARETSVKRMRVIAKARSRQALPRGPF